MKQLFFSLILLFSTIKGISQNFTINGYVSDNKSGEILIGAAVYENEKFRGTTSNVYGFYSLTLPKGEYTLIFSYVGYSKKELKIVLDKDISLDMGLASELFLNEFEVVADYVERIEERTQMSAIEISVDQIKNIPALLGERDVLKAIQLLPGVQSGGEGTSGLYVRGGGPDQNLILLDGVPVYNASHLFGFFSVFNPDAINSVQLIKGGFPARYGGRLSSVLDIRMKEGNNEKLKGEGSVGIVASKLTLEGPIGKNTTFIVSGRRTYIDILAQPLIRAAASASGENIRAGYYFYDANAKINTKINQNNRIFFSSYLGRDRAYSKYTDKYSFQDEKFEYNSNADLGWGNLTSALRWNSILTNRLFMNTTLTYSNYNFLVSAIDETKYDKIGQPIQSDYFSYEYNSGIRDYTIKTDLDFIPNPNHYIRFGAGNIFHRFTPGVNSFTSKSNEFTNVDTTTGAEIVFGSEYFAYIEDDIKIGSGRLKINPGLHFSGFAVEGTNYLSLQPRVAARYLLRDDVSIKASVATMTQFIHLLSNATIGLPTDLWVPATARIKPQESIQYALGVAKTIRKGFEVSLEFYYKEMENLIEYKDGASFLAVASDWQNLVEVGRGTSYGMEVFIQKKMGKTTGWIGYTLSKTDRQFDNINFGEPFPYRYDRRHDISIVFMHKFNDRVDVAATWVYGTGNAVTLATQRYPSLPPNSDFFSFGNSFGDIEYVNERNGFREPAYHRLDVGVNLHSKTEKRGWDKMWSFGAYNAYSRANPFYLRVDYDFRTQRNVLKQISLFPIIPYVTYSLKF